MGKMKQDFLGIDACRGGWAGASLDAHFRYTGELLFWPSAEEFLAGIERWQLSLIDIPIGLTDDVSGTRSCEPLARAMLGARRASIFSPPVRLALDAQNYAEACRINAEVCGRKISIQSWNIVPKIREVDAVLRNKPALQSHLRESHPELCFCHLNDGNPFFAKKKTREGREVRLAVLEKFSPNARPFFQANLAKFRRKTVAADDLIDAMVLALAAARGAKFGLTRLPQQPEYDRFGLRMEMVFA